MANAFLRATSLAALQTALTAEEAASRFYVNGSLRGALDPDEGYYFYALTSSSLPSSVTTLTQSTSITAVQALVSGSSVAAINSFVDIAPILGGIYLIATSVFSGSSYVGAVLQSVRAEGVQLALVNAVPANLITGGLVLPRGTWMIQASANFLAAGGAVVGTRIALGVSTTSATFPVESYSIAFSPTLPSVSSNMTLRSPPVALTVASSATVYAPCSSNFTTFGVNVYGTLTANCVSVP